MKLYWDKERFKEVNTVNFSEVEAGQSKDIMLYIYNETKAVLKDIKVEVFDKEVKVVSYPERMLPESMDVIRLRWTPSLQLKKGLKTTIQISGQEVYG